MTARLLISLPPPAAETQTMLTVLLGFQSCAAGSLAGVLLAGAEDAAGAALDAGADEHREGEHTG